MINNGDSLKQIQAKRKNGELLLALQESHSILSEEPANFDVMLEYNSIIEELRSKSLRSYMHANGVPPILLVTLWGTGSRFIRQELTENLRIPIRDEVTVGADLYGTLERKRLRNLVEEGGVVFSHIYPTKANLVALKNSGLKKMIFNLRDPRQATLSVMHYFNRINQDRIDRLLPMLDNMLPGYSFNWPEMRQIDYMIENFLPPAIELLVGWSNQDTNPDFNIEIKFTHYERLRQDYTRFFEEIMEFYEIDRTRFNFSKRPRSYEQGEAGFRKGLLNEWRSVMTIDQQDKATSMIPEYLFEHFSWEK